MTDRLYYSDSGLLEFCAKVTAGRTVDGRRAVELDRTAFYPTSGGQPYDTGQLAGVPVVDVVDLDDSVLHVLAGDAPLPGTDVVGKIDPIRRRDHTQQHTGQHVLSQAFERVADLRTVSFHLGSDACTIDLDRPTVSAVEIQAAEEQANAVVLEDREILIHFAAAEDLARYGLRKPTERTGTIRIVEIADFDRSACGGTHVRRTGQIGPIKVRRWERRGATVRVEFLCGWRALNDYRLRLDATRAIAERLSIGDSEVASAVGRILDDSARQRVELTVLREQLLTYEAAELLATAPILENAKAVRLVRHTFDDRPAEELKRLALRIAEKGTAVVLFGSTGARSHLVFAQTPGLTFNVANLIREVAPLVGARGGGSRDLAQAGKADGGSVDPALDAAERAISLAI